MYIILGVVIAALLLFAAFSKAQAPEGITQLSAEEFKTEIETKKDIQIIDVRTAGEHKGGYIKNSVLMDFHGSNFKTNAMKLDKEKPVYIYCASGGRSMGAAKILHKEGYEVYNLVGGFGAWRGKGYPSVK